LAAEHRGSVGRKINVPYRGERDITMKITAREVAEHLGIDYVVASGLMTALVEKGLAKHTENRKHPTGKGKPTRVFDVDRVISLELFPAPAATVAVEEVSVENDHIEDAA